ncbi:MAG: AMP-binding protein [Candidatus Omnitrophica bacterium]|nr:AMP-binding protein [Candidatus Omnitrophota bacterium]
MDLRQKFKENILKYPHKVAIQTKQDSTWSQIHYYQLNQQIQSLSSWLFKQGLRRSERVVIILNNRLEWPLIFFSTIYLGAVVVPISPDSPKKEIENILTDSEPKLIFVDGSSFLCEQENLKSITFVTKIISIDSSLFKETIKSFPRNNDIESIAIEDDDLACILYTSGTTDEPKGVMLTHKNLLSNYISLDKFSLLSRSDSVISILPLHHAYSLMSTLILPFLCGAKVVYPGSLHPDVIIEALQETGTTKFIVVPQILYLFHRGIQERMKKIFFPLRAVLKIMIECLWFVRKKTRLNLVRFLLFNLHNRFGNRLQFFVSGGARIDSDIEKDFFKLGFTIIEGYGLTETSPVLTLNPPSDPKIGSVGKPIMDVEIKIDDKNEQGIGEVVAKGSNIMKGYYKRPDLTKEVIKNGWFYTGDTGYLDRDGYLFLTGRQKEVIVLSSGLNIFPEEIETHYAKSPFIKEICVFEATSKKGSLKKTDILYGVAVPNLEYFKKWGEVNLRFVIKERFENLSKELPPHKRMMGFILTHQALPRTVLGKIKRYAVKEMYLDQIAKEESVSQKQREITEEDKFILETDISKNTLNYLKKQTKIDRPIYLDDGLEIDLGIDSLGRIELASGLKATFGIEIKDEVIGKVFTVRDLIGEIQSLLSKETKVIEKEKISLDSDYWRNIIEILPSKENIEKIDLNPDWLSWTAAFLFTGFWYLFFRIFYNLKIEGKDNIPSKGPYILYANHTSYFDGLIIAASLPQDVILDLFFVGFRPYFDVPIIRNLIKTGRIIPLDFASHLLEALRSSFYVLKHSKNLCLFPEGLRSLDGKPREFKRGFGILSKESQTKLIPVLIDGAWQAWPRTSNFPRRHPIRIKFGLAYNIDVLEEQGIKEGAKDKYEAICIGARKELIRLKPELP